MMKMMKEEKGFTLIELLVVVAIIGILVAIAIPQFASYKISANNSTAQSQLRNLAVAMESYYVNNNTYPSATSSLSGYNATTNVTAAVASSSATAWTATAYHSGGNTTYTWSSQSGGLQ